MTRWSADHWEPSTFASHMASASRVDEKRNLEWYADDAPTAYLTSAQVTKLPGHLATGVYLLTPIWVLGVRDVVTTPDMQ